jgi:serine/threonine protein kinase
MPDSQRGTVPYAPDAPTRLAAVPNAALSEQITPLNPPHLAVEEWPKLAEFDLRAELARGGVGVIYLAYEPALKRTVAVKVLQSRFRGDPTITQRFLEEAQITGQLQHPGIPPIYRVGWLEDGRPYLAMKLIKGETLAERLQRGAEVNILAIFEAVAQAVGYAHAHGVIHRDLKPQNIMIGPYGEVQVMDWGLAKVVDAPAAVQTVVHDPREVAGATDTLQGSVLGTPAYMAPEQAAGGHVDQRADVFGLGAVLCTMLTGRPPFDGALPRLILLQAAQGRLDSAYARLDACGADPEVIRLCRRCLAAEPAERPADGNTVAQEVAALRAAVEARARQAELDRAKFAVYSAEQRKRRRLSLALVGLLLAGLIATSSLAWWASQERDEKERQRAEAESQRARAEQNEAQAQQSEAESRAVLDFVVEKVFAAARPREEPGGLGHDARLIDAIQAALPYVQQSFPQQPLTAARLRRTIGLTFLVLGRAGQAVEQLEVARDLYQRHRGPAHADTLTTMNLLANGYAALGRHDDALTLREQTLAKRRQVLGPYHRDTLTSMNNLALSYAALGRRAEAVRLHEETLALRQQHLGVDHPDTLSSMNNLAQALQAVGRHDEARHLQQKTLALQRATLGPEHTDTLGSMNNLALSYFAEGRFEDARRLHAEALRLREATLGPEHPETLTSVNNLALAHFALGQHAEALRLFRRAAAARLRRAELAADDLDNRLNLGGLLGNIGHTLLQLGQTAEAVETLEQAEDHLLYVLKRQPKADQARLFLRTVHINYAMAAERLRRYDEADAHWQKAIELTPDHELPEAKRTRDFWRKKRPASDPDAPDPAQRQ